jgi:phospholipid/cholesterol/gamma-HCH transport system substrate-binding protein
VKRTGRVPFMRLQVGLLVLVTFVLLLWATFQSGRLPIFAQEDRIDLLFPAVGGLEEEAIVRLNGVPVGHVRKIELEPGGNRVRVVLGVERGTRARVHQGAEARITTVGFLSELYVAIDGGNPALPSIRSDTEIGAIGASDPQVLFRKMEVMSDTLEVLLANLSRAGRKLGHGEGTLGKLSRDDRLYDQMVSLSRNASQLAERVNENQEKLSGRFLSLAASIDSLTDRMQHGEGTVAQLINSGELHQRLMMSTTRLDSMLSVIESGRGSLGRLYADSTLYDDTRALVSSMKRLMAEIEKNPKKYFKFSLF